MRLAVPVLVLISVLPVLAQERAMRHVPHEPLPRHHGHGGYGPNVIVEPRLDRDRCAGPSHGTPSVVVVDGEGFAAPPRRADHCPRY